MTTDQAIAAADVIAALQPLDHDEQRSMLAAVTTLWTDDHRVLKARRNLSEMTHPTEARNGSSVGS